MGKYTGSVCVRDGVFSGGLDADGTVTQLKLGIVIPDENIAHTGRECLSGLLFLRCGEAGLEVVSDALCPFRLSRLGAHAMKSLSAGGA